MPEGEFQRFLSRSLRLLEREAPACWNRLQSSMGGRSVRLRVDEPMAVLQFDGQGFRWLADEAPADIDVAVDKATILDLTDGRVSLDASILSDRLSLRGPVESVELFYEGLLAYLEGAVRSPSLPRLMDEYRGCVG